MGPGHRDYDTLLKGSVCLFSQIPIPEAIHEEHRFFSRALFPFKLRLAEEEEFETQNKNLLSSQSTFNHWATFGTLVSHLLNLAWLFFQWPSKRNYISPSLLINLRHITCSRKIRARGWKAFAWHIPRTCFSHPRWSASSLDQFLRCSQSWTTICVLAAVIIKGRITISHFLWWIWSGQHVMANKRIFFKWHKALPQILIRH